jgi:hypothetical protein
VLHPHIAHVKRAVMVLDEVEMDRLERLLGRLR